MLDALRLMVAGIVKAKSARALAPLIPNEKTIEAMKAARRGDVVAVGSPDKLVACLNENG